MESLKPNKAQTEGQELTQKMKQSVKEQQMLKLGKKRNIQRIVVEIDKRKYNVSMKEVAKLNYEEEIVALKRVGLKKEPLEESSRLNRIRDLEWNLTRMDVEIQWAKDERVLFEEELQLALKHLN